MPSIFPNVDGLNKISKKTALKLISSLTSKNISVQISNDYYQIYPDYSQLKVCSDFHVSKVEITKVNIIFWENNINKLSFCINDINDSQSSFLGDILFLKLIPIQNVFIDMYIIIIK